MTRRQRQIADAAGPVFLGQGLTRTTMGDIATAAGVSRQGLYLASPNKEAVFAAAVLVLTEQQDIELAAGLPHRAELRTRLAFVCERWLVGVFDLQRSTPDARDMDDLAFPVVREVYQRFVDRVAALLGEACGDAVAPAMMVDLARILVFGIRGYSATAVDGPDMRRLTALQIDFVAGHVEATVAAHAAARAPRKLRA
ncbi:MAG: TetR/AcrR family transcriptional regulator [Sphingomonadaceae bacterium]|nr:TetR/AcrR family transcriptional regulator [Sphingomonadaceae bacterium]